MVSYLPINKIKNNIGFDPFNCSGRVTIKIGRIVNKLIDEHYIKIHNVNDSQIEKFVNSYKAWFDSSDAEFKIVNGEDIKTWYLDKNYYVSPSGSALGTLWNSCMRYEERQKCLELYCNNTNIKMLVLIQNQNGIDKVRSRAILWDNVIHNGESIKVMDRIYSFHDSDVDLFKKWANENGYIPKLEQNAKSHQFFEIKGIPTRIRCSVKLDNKEFEYYPYLDTFQFFDKENGILHNDEYNQDWKYRLVQANGSLTPPLEHEDMIEETQVDDFDMIDDQEII
jgi:hypothetical protein